MGKWKIVNHRRNSRPLFRQAKTAAAQQGSSLKELLTVALRAQLPKQAGLSGPSNPLMRAFGGLRDLHRESKRLENASYKGSSGAFDQEKWR
jgi:hypothetical protein